MRFTEFDTTKEVLDEVDMSPSSLKKLAAQTGAQAGMEFEMIVPDTEDPDNDDDQEPDYDVDETTDSISNIIEFFSDSNYNSSHTLSRLRNRLQSEFEEYASEEINRQWDDRGEQYLRDYIEDNYHDTDVDIRTELENMGLDEEDIDAAMEAGQGARGITSSKNLPTTDAYKNYKDAVTMAEEAIDSEAEREWRNGGGIYGEAYDSFVDETEVDEEDWLRDNYRYMSDISNEFDVTWPYYTSDSNGGRSIDEIAEEFSTMINKPVNASERYHGARREPGHYVVEPDSSLEADDSGDSGLEFVSPPMPIDEMISDLNKVKKWADSNGCYTNDSTGLHINVSVPALVQNTNSLDYVKLAILLGDQYVLDQFGRAGNTYCKSAMQSIEGAIRNNPATALNLLEKMKSGLDKLASKAIHSGVTTKYTSINNKEGYIEFRSPGGDWLNENFDKIENTLLRMVVALDAACDPEKYKREYLTKLYKLLDVKSVDDPIAYFAQYATGKLPRSALASFVRQIQYNRKYAKDNAKQLAAQKAALANQPTIVPDQNGNFELYVTQTASADAGRPGQSVTRFNADSMQTARQLARNYINGHGKNLADYDVREVTTTATTPTTPLPTDTTEYEIYDRTTGQAMHRFEAVSGDAAWRAYQAWIRLYRATNPNTPESIVTSKFGVRPA